MPDATHQARHAGAAAREALLGAFFLAVGSASAWEATRYPLGSARDMGPGYFPLCLGLLLAVIGLALLARSLPGVAWARWRAGAVALRGSHLWPIALSLLAFGLTVEHAGVFLSTAGLVIASSAAGEGFRWRSATVWALVVASFCSLLFVVLLGMQLPVWPNLSA